MQNRKRDTEVWNKDIVLKEREEEMRKVLNVYGVALY